ncbi:MAG TPA: outer membrane protein assembly factor BamE [Burkholderiales bacterium]|jgi:hypothetical protein|nr:outer membrane protein assembly factor BamE [Burkholderiales bacterium]
MRSATAAVFVLSAALLLAACSKVTQENFARIQDGMTEQQVAAILGAPTETSSGSILGIAGTSSTWRDGDAVIAIRFVDGKAVLKSFEKPGARK